MEILNQQIKNFIKDYTLLSSELLHVYAGILIYLVWLIIFKNKYSTYCLLGIVLAALVNEVLDLKYYFDKIGRLKWMASLFDIFHTLFLPFIMHGFLKFYRKNLLGKSD